MSLEELINDLAYITKEEWQDEFGNYWSVGLEVVRDFKNATPIKDY